MSPKPTFLRFETEGLWLKVSNALPESKRVSNVDTLLNIIDDKAVVIEWLFLKRNCGRIIVTYTVIGIYKHFPSSIIR